MGLARATLLYFTLGIQISTFVERISEATKVKRGYGPTEIPLTDQEKMEIVRHHNDLRRLSASSNMRFMSWDSELEWIAQQYSVKCNFQHNSARTHSRGWSVGENIYVTMDRRMPGSRLGKAIQSWYDEIGDFSYATRKCAPGKMCGHYTQIVWADTFKVGCALTSCKYLSQVNWNGGGSILVCNYATSGNVHSQDGKLLPVFEMGPPCSNCDDGDYCRSHLCANGARDFLIQLDAKETCKAVNDQSSVGLVVGIVVLAISILFLVGFIIYRERVRISVRLGLWRVGAGRSNKFSNQATPATSTFNTPRHSITGTNLHGVHRLVASDIGSPIEKLKASERGHCSSAPTTPRHGYSKGSHTPPRVPPPIPPPTPHK